MAPTLGYWKIRGLAQAIRYLLEYAGAEYEEKRYECGPPPTFDKSHWLDEKFNLGLDFPNIPYYIDGNVKLTQANAILRYLAKKYNLDGKTEEELNRQNMAMEVCADMRMAISFAMYAFFGEFEAGKANYAKDLPGKIKSLSDYLGNRKWITGHNINMVDFVIYELLYVNNKFIPGCLDNFKNLQDYMARFEALPAIKKYMASERFIVWPLNGRVAKWGGDI